MSPRTPEQYEKIRSDRKQAILDAALHAFAEEGYHGTSISKVAKKAGVSKGLMYNYFESKEELLTYLLLELFEKVKETLNLDEEGAINDNLLIAYIDKTIAIVDEDRAAWKLYFSMLAQKEVMEISMKVLLPKIQPFMGAMIQYFANKGDQEPEATFRYFMATMDGIKMQFLFDPENFPIQKVKKQLINQFVEQ